MTRIYVASSWRNEYYPEVVQKLRDCGFDVYDFRNPPSGDEVFHWCNVSDKWLDWTPEEYPRLTTKQADPLIFSKNADCQWVCYSQIVSIQHFTQ